MSATQQVLRFGVFELNLTTEELRKSDVALKLPPQPLKLLTLLAGCAGHVVTREEIQRQFWGDESDIDFERRMNQCIQQVRTALGDHAGQPLYIETVHRHGYRFIAPVQAKTILVPEPKLVEYDSGRVPVAVDSGTKALAVLRGRAVAPSYSVAAPDAEAVATLKDEATHIAKSRSPIWNGRRVWVGAAVVLVAVIGLAVYWRAHKAPMLTEKDTIVLADFDNKTGDPVFDDTLKQGLAIQLDQSPFLHVLSDRKVAATLKLMNRSGSERLTEDVAHEVCLRTNSKAMLMGAIAQLGSQYVIGVKAMDCNTGEVLAETQKEATGKEFVLGALDAAAVSLRSKLGESLNSVQKYDTPLRDVTTPSLDALKAYSLGEKTSSAKGNSAALPFYEHALELDPNFATAYSAISSVYLNLNEVGRAAEAARKAYELREKVSERERFSIEGTYYLSATGELDKAAQTYELWQQTYPRDDTPYTGLVFIYASLGSSEKTFEEARHAIHLDPNDSTNYNNLGIAYTTLNQLDNAEAVYEQAEKRSLEDEVLLQDRYLLAFLKGDTAQMARMASAAMGRPGAEDILLASQADTEGWYGRLKRARELTKRAIDSARHNDAGETAATYQAAAALREVEASNRQEAVANAQAAVRLAPNRDVRAMAALALARAGNIAEAEKLAAGLDKAFPLDTLVQRYWLPTIRAAIALYRKDPSHAVKLLETVSGIELGQPTNITVFLCPAYLRGEAYLMLHDSTAAVAEFQKFIDHYGLVGNFPWGALARLGLARAYALEAQTDPAIRDKARTAYQNFLTLWKDADPDIPIYKQAKAECAKLH